MMYQRIVTCFFFENKNLHLLITYDINQFYVATINEMRYFAIQVINYIDKVSQTPIRENVLRKQTYLYDYNRF